jgi:hypothetical protein
MSSSYSGVFLANWIPPFCGSFNDLELIVDFFSCVNFPFLLSHFCASQEDTAAACVFTILDV